MLTCPQVNDKLFVLLGCILHFWKSISQYLCSSFCGRIWQFVCHFWWFKSTQLSVFQILQKHQTTIPITLTITIILIVLFFIQSRHELNAVVLFEIIFEGGYAFGLVLISCELGQQMTDAFESCNTVLCELEWYLFPVGIRKMLPPILLIAQVPVRLECFGSNACTRESFKKVCIVWLWNLTEYEQNIVHGDNKLQTTTFFF